MRSLNSIAAFANIVLEAMNSQSFAFPQRLKPIPSFAFFGTAEAVPFQKQ